MFQLYISLLSRPKNEKRSTDILSGRSCGDHVFWVQVDMKKRWTHSTKGLYVRDDPVRFEVLLQSRSYWQVFFFLLLMGVRFIFCGMRLSVV